MADERQERKEQVDQQIETLRKVLDAVKEDPKNAFGEEVQEKLKESGIKDKVVQDTYREVFPEVATAIDENREVLEKFVKWEPASSAHEINERSSALRGLFDAIGLNEDDWKEMGTREERQKFVEDVVKVFPGKKDESPDDLYIEIPPKEGERATKGEPVEEQNKKEDAKSLPNLDKAREKLKDLKKENIRDGMSFSKTRLETILESSIDDRLDGDEQVILKHLKWDNLKEAGILEQRDARRLLNETEKERLKQLREEGHLKFREFVKVEESVGDKRKRDPRRSTTRVNVDNDDDPKEKGEKPKSAWTTSSPDDFRPRRSSRPEAQPAPSTPEAGKKSALELEIERIGHENLIKTIGGYERGTDPTRGVGGKYVKEILKADDPDVDLSRMSGREKWARAQEIYFRFITRGEDGNSSVVLIRDSALITGGTDGDKLASLKDARGKIEREMAKMKILLEKDLGKVNLQEKGEFMGMFRRWAVGGIEKKIGDLEIKTKDSNLYEKITNPDEWIGLARKEFREREVAFKQYSREFEKAGLETNLGLEVPMFKHMKDFPALREQLKNEATAREGIHNAFVAWRANCTNLDSLTSSLGFPVKGREAPTMMVGQLDLGWMETLATAEKGLGRDVGECLKIYMHLGENNGDNNIFSRPLQPAQIEKIRSQVRGRVGEDAESLGYRIMYLFGLAGKYNFDQHPGCSERDDLASIYRPNDYWQGLRASNTTIPAPHPIIGTFGNPSQQNFRNISFLESYPEIVGDVVLRDGTSMDFYDALYRGRFADVRWDEISMGYGVFSWRISNGNKLKTKLSDMAPTREDTINVDSLMGMADLIVKTIPHKMTASYSTSQRKTSDGVIWNARERKLPKKEDAHKDKRVQAILFNWGRSVLDRHNPQNSDVPPTQYWDLNDVEAFLKSMGSVLTSGRVSELSAQSKKIRWGFVLGSKKAGRI